MEAAAPARIQVIARLRPAAPCELGGCFEANESTSSITALDDKGIERSFAFTACFGPNATQDAIFPQVQALVNLSLCGMNACIFAFGCSGSGKSHTMQGSNPNDPGIIPRTVHHLLSSDENLTLSISYYEVYQSKVYDLLVRPADAHATRQDLPVRECDNKVFVAGLTEQSISSYDAFCTLYLAATARRATGSTKLNSGSSRSHAILEIKVKNDRPSGALIGKVTLVDLAGSENNKRTGDGNDPLRLKESAEINLSLSTLRSVVAALNRGEKRVPYRDSKLTRILSDTLGGESAGLIIANIAPDRTQYQDTLNTLNFATLSRTVENRPVASDTRILAPLPRPNITRLHYQRPQDTSMSFNTSFTSSIVSRSAAGRTGHSRYSDPIVIKAKPRTTLAPPQRLREERKSDSDLRIRLMVSRAVDEAVNAVVPAAVSREQVEQILEEREDRKGKRRRDDDSDGEDEVLGKRARREMEAKWQAERQAEREEHRREMQELRDLKAQMLADTQRLAQLIATQQQIQVSAAMQPQTRCSPGQDSGYAAADSSTASDSSCVVENTTMASTRTVSDDGQAQTRLIHEGWIKAGLAAERDGNLIQAAAHFSQALKITPNHTKLQDRIDQLELGLRRAAPTAESRLRSRLSRAGQSKPERKYQPLL